MDVLILLRSFRACLIVNKITTTCFCKHSIASVDISMKSNTFALQNIKQRIWQAVKILNDTGTLQPGVKDKWNINCFFLSKEWYRLLSV